jgi:hypothetical protein
MCALNSSLVFFLVDFWKNFCETTELTQVCVVVTAEGVRGQRLSTYFFICLDTHTTTNLLLGVVVGGSFSFSGLLVILHLLLRQHKKVDAKIYTFYDKKISF